MQVPYAERSNKLQLCGVRVRRTEGEVGGAAAAIQDLQRPLRGGELCLLRRLLRVLLLPSRQEVPDEASVSHQLQELVHLAKLVLGRSPGREEGREERQPQQHDRVWEAVEDEAA